MKINEDYDRTRFWSVVFKWKKSRLWNPEKSRMRIENIGFLHWKLRLPGPPHPRTLPPPLARLLRFACVFPWFSLPFALVFHQQAFPPKKFCTNRFLHQEVFHTKKLLHQHVFKPKGLYTNELTDMFLHQHDPASLYTQHLFAPKRLYTNKIYKCSPKKMRQQGFTPKHFCFYRFCLACSH